MKIWHKICKIFIKKQNPLGKMYFVKHGEKLGQFLILISFDQDKKIYSVLGLPDSDPLYISEKDIESGISNKILEYIQTMPKDILNDCRKEFEYRSQKSINN